MNKESASNYYMTKIEEIHKVIGKIEGKVSIFSLSAPKPSLSREIGEGSQQHTVLGMALSELLSRIENLEDTIA